MPCFDNSFESRPDPHRLLQMQHAEAILCGLLTAIEQNTSVEAALKQVDWEQAGVSIDSARLWWADHKAKDASKKEP